MGLQGGSTGAVEEDWSLTSKKQILPKEARKIQDLENISEPTVQSLKIKL